MKLDFEVMWNEAKEEFAKYPEPEALSILEQIEENETKRIKKEDVIDELIKEVLNNDFRNNI